MKTGCRLVVAAVILALLAQDSGAQQKKKPAGGVAEVTAEDIGKEFLKAKEKAQKKYQDKTVRVRGAVEMAQDNLVYLRTGLKYKEGQPMSIVFRFPEGAKPGVSASDKVVLEGKFQLEAVLGPSFTEARVVEGKK
jgi:hypothetical protein